MHLVRYYYQDGVVFDGFGGFPIESEWFVGFANSVKEGYEVLTPSTSPYSYEQLFVLFLSYYQAFGWEPVWEDDGSISLRKPSLDFLKRIKMNTLRDYVASLLSQSDWIVLKLQSMHMEGWSNVEIQDEMKKYMSVLEKRKRIREWNRQMEKAIESAQTKEELESLKIRFME